MASRSRLMKFVMTEIKYLLMDVPILLAKFLTDGIALFKMLPVFLIAVMD